jgi:hypothetical protein
MIDRYGPYALLLFACLVLLGNLLDALEAERRSREK